MHKGIDIECKIILDDVIKFELLEDTVVNGFIIPAGYISDGCSSPRLLWAKFPTVDKYFKRYLLHDYMYDTHCVQSRKEADLYLYRGLIRDGMCILSALEIYLGVRLGGKSHWW